MVGIPLSIVSGWILYKREVLGEDARVELGKVRGVEGGGEGGGDGEGGGEKGEGEGDGEGDGGKGEGSSGGIRDPRTGKRAKMF